MIGKSTSLHQNTNGLCVFLSFSSGKKWGLSATPILPGRDNPCPQVSAGDSRFIYERELEEAIAQAKAHGEKTMTLRVNGHEVKLIAKNVEAKIRHAHELEASYPFNKPKKRRKKSR